MPTPSKPANQRQRTWRAQAVQPEQKARRRRVFRVLLPVIGFCLLAALATVLILWFLRPPKLDLIAIAVADYRNPEVPPIAYCYEDLEALRKAIDAEEAGGTSWNDASADKIAQLDTALAATSSSRDNVLVYIKAHGVSLNESPYLLDSSFELRGRAGRLPVGKLLTDMAESPARIKLLVLDTGHLASDPRMGMLANEFTLLVEKLVAAMPAEKNVWVLTSNSLFEQTQVSLKDRRSAFNYYLAEGLQGAADGVLAESERDGLVQLDELYAYVREQVIQYARLTSSDRQSQTPVLMHSGEGEVADPPHEDLLRIESDDSDEDEAKPVALRRARPPEPTGTERRRHLPLAMVLLGNQSVEAAQPASAAGNGANSAAATQAPATAEPAGPAKDDSKKADPAAAAKETPATGAQVAPAATKDNPVAADQGGKKAATQAPAKQPTRESAEKPKPRQRSPVEQSLHDRGAWLENQQQRDELWRPMDYAPALTRLYYESLRGCRQRALAGELFLKVPAYQSSLTNKLSEVQQLQRRIDEHSAAFVRGLARPSYERDEQVRAAIRLRNQVLFLLPWLIEHQAISSANVQPRMQSELAALITATAQLDRSLMRELEPRNPASSFDQWKQSLAVQAEQVRNRLSTLQNEFRTRYEEQNRLANGPVNPSVAPRLNDLARSPFASVEQREDLEAMARQAARSFAEVEKQGSTAQRRPTATDRKRLADSGWQRVIDRAELELELVTLLQTSQDPLLDETRKALTTSGGLTNADSRMGLVRKIDRRLADAYGNLPEEIRDQLKSDQYQSWRLAETAIRLSDARDQKRIEGILDERLGRQWSDPIAGVPLKAIPDQIARYQLTLGNGQSASSPIPLSYAVAQRLPVRFSSNELLPPERLRLRLDYNAQRVQVKNAQGTELAPGRILPAGQAVSGSAREHLVNLEIASLDERGEETRLSLTWLDENDRELARETAALIHPEPKFSQLAVYGQAGTADHAWQRSQADGSYFEAPFNNGIAHVRLTTFAGHQTQYDFRLTNPATHPKKYQAEIFALPRPDEPSRVRDVQSLALAATTRGVRLAANVLQIAPGGTVSIPFFPAPQPAAAGKEAPAGPDAAKAADAKAADATAKPLAPEITSGVVCVLSEDAASTAGAAAAELRRQVIVVEFETQHPDNYITPRVEYNARDGKITAMLSVPDRDRLPPGGAKVEIEVVTQEQVRQGPDAVRAASVTQQDPEQILRVYAPTGTPASAEVFLHVDGYPRAFVYELPLDASLPNAERILLDLRRISLPNPASFRIYYPGRVTEAVRFPFQVDMPPSQDRAYLARLFIDRQPGGEFNPDEDRVLVQSPQDRVHQVTLIKPEGAPGMAVQTQVSDFVTMLDLSPYLNEVHVRAQLVRREQDREEVLGNSDGRADKEIVLYLDGEAPTVTARGPNRAVEPNEVFRVDVFPRDQVTAIDKLEFALGTLPKPDSKDPDERILAEPKPVPQLRNGAYQLAHAFEAPGEKDLWFQATDKSGNKSELKRVLITVRKPAPTSPGGQPAVAEFGQIVGRATLPPGAGGGIDKVVLSDGKGVVDEVSKPSNGEFRFDKVRPGEYTLKAEGTVSGNFGKPVIKKVTVEAGKTTGPVTVHLGR